MKNVLIVEDRKVTAQCLEKIIREIEHDIHILFAFNKEEAYTMAMEIYMDLMIVDIVLDTSVPNDVSGMKFAKNIRRVDKYKFIPIIIVSALEDPKLYAYSEIHCYSYIEKPFDLKQTKKVIREALEYKKEVSKNEKYIYKKHGIFYSIDLEEILYIETIRGQVTIFTVRDRIHIPYITFAKLLLEIDNEDFVQCNRHCIVNRKYIERADAVNRYIKLKNVSEQIEIGISLKKKFLEELKKK